jgi:hypothetical protein
LAGGALPGGIAVDQDLSLFPVKAWNTFIAPESLG